MTEDIDLKQKMAAIRIQRKDISSAQDYIRVLKSGEMFDLRVNHSAACADLCAEFISAVPENQRVHCADFLLSGKFASRLAFKQPEHFATLFMRLRALLNDQDMRFFAITVRLDGENRFWLLRPTFRGDELIPVIIDASAPRAYPLDRNISSILPEKVYDELQRELWRSPLPTRSHHNKTGQFLRIPELY